MKKSKIILPAVALLTISTVAAASSTVAWFSASRAVNVSLSQVAVYNPESDLNVTLVKDDNAGTSVDNTKNAQIVTLPSYMRDGSVDAANKKVYKKDVVTSEYSLVNGYSTDTATIAGESKVIYRATHWTMNFSMVGASTNDYGVLLDMGTTKCTIVDSEDNGKVSQAFRIAFVSEDAVTVLAPFSTATSLTYVKDTDGAIKNDGAYTSEIVSSSLKDKAIKTSEVTATTDFKAAKGYVGTIDKSTDGTVQTLSVECYAWFEGEDPNCKVPEGGLNTKITSLLSFYAVRVVA